MSGTVDLVKRALLGRAIASSRLGRDAAAQEDRAAGLLLRPDLLGRLRDRADRAGARRRRRRVGFLGLAAPIAVGRRGAAGSSSSRRTGRPASPTPAAVGRTSSARTTSGETAALTAAAALLVDYVMTVAVSVVSGVVAITSAVTVAWRRTRSRCRSASSSLLALVNLRGVRESGTAFAFPTYAFVGADPAAAGVRRVPRADRRPAGRVERAARAAAAPRRSAAAFTFLLCLRAFASGCTALTGVEAISNGVPAFQKPKSRNAAATLVIMGALAITHVLRHHRARAGHPRAGVRRAATRR